MRHKPAIAISSTRALARVAITMLGISTGLTLGGLIGFLMVIFFTLFLDRAGGTFTVAYLTVPLGALYGGAMGGVVVNFLGNRWTPGLNQKHPLIRWYVRVLAAGVSAYLIGGFFAGVGEAVFQYLTQLIPLASLVAAALDNGFIRCVESILHFGLIPESQQAEPLNTWPYIIGCWAINLFAITLWSRQSQYKRTSFPDR